MGSSEFGKSPFLCTLYVFLKTLLFHCGVFLFFIECDLTKFKHGKSNCLRKAAQKKLTNFGTFPKGGGARPNPK